MNTEGTNTPDGLLIRKLIDARDQAMFAKDPRALSDCYSSTSISFDLAPPFRSNGAQAFSHFWDACLNYFPVAEGTEIRDFAVEVDGNHAFALWLWRISGEPVDNRSNQTWVRCTAILRRVHEGWKIVHEHCSIPYHPDSSSVVYTLEP